MAILGLWSLFLPDLTMQKVKILKDETESEKDDAKEEDLFDEDDLSEDGRRKNRKPKKLKFVSTKPKVTNLHIHKQFIINH